MILTELRKVARDAYVSWHGSRYSVPWEYAGKEVWVRECGGGRRPEPLPDIVTLYTVKRKEIRCFSVAARL